MGIAQLCHSSLETAYSSLSSLPSDDRCLLFCHPALTSETTAHISNRSPKPVVWPAIVMIVGIYQNFFFVPRLGLWAVKIADSYNVDDVHVSRRLCIVVERPRHCTCVWWLNRVEWFQPRGYAWLGRIDRATRGHTYTCTVLELSKLYMHHRVAQAPRALVLQLSSPTAHSVLQWSFCFDTPEGFVREELALNQWVFDEDVVCAPETTFHWLVSLPCFTNLLVSSHKSTGRLWSRGWDIRAVCNIVSSVRLVGQESSWSPTRFWEERPRVCVLPRWLCPATHESTSRCFE